MERNEKLKVFVSIWGEEGENLCLSWEYTEEEQWITDIFIFFGMSNQKNDVCVLSVSFGIIFFPFHSIGYDLRWLIYICLNSGGKYAGTQRRFKLSLFMTFNKFLGIFWYGFHWVSQNVYYKIIFKKMWLWCLYFRLHYMMQLWMGVLIVLNQFWMQELIWLSKM